MNKILVIGSPGSGKSTFSKRLAKALNYPVLHIDKIFHIDNENHITKSELKEKIKNFILKNNQFIIDGNYTGSLEYRLTFADTVFYFDIDPEICLKNVIKRCKDGGIRDDMAPGFDNSIIDPEFIEYVKNFNNNIKPITDDIIENSFIKPIYFYNYQDVENFLKKVQKN